MDTWVPYLQAKLYPDTLTSQIIWVYVILNIILIEYAYRKIEFLKEKNEKRDGPFWSYRRLDTERWARWKFHLGAIFTGMIPRCLLVGATVGGLLLWTKICSIGAPRNEPYGPLRRELIRKVANPVGRLTCFWTGLWWINRVDKRRIDPKTCEPEWAPIITVNHVSWIDIPLFIGNDCPSFVAKVSVENIPFVGPLARAIQCLFVQRANDQSRAEVIEQVKKRQNQIYDAQGKGYPQLLIFAEGTTTNGASMVRFKRGPFASGLPIQPVGLQFDGPFFGPDMGVIPFDVHMILCLSQPWLSLTMTFLPVYKPKHSTEDWEKDAGILKEIMSKEMGIKMSDLTYREKVQYYNVIYKTKIKET